MSTITLGPRTGIHCPPYGDGPALIRSIRENLLPPGDEVSFLCDHGPGSTIALERWTNAYAGEGAGGAGPSDLPCRLIWRAGANGAQLCMDTVPPQKIENSPIGRIETSNCVYVLLIEILAY